MDTKTFIRTIYLYFFSLVGLFFLVFGTIGLVKLGLVTWIFPKADMVFQPKPLLPDRLNENDLVEGLEVCKTTCELTELQKERLENWLADYNRWQEAQESPDLQRSSQRQRQISENLASIIVGLPLYLYHWTIIKRDAKKRKSLDK